MRKFAGVLFALFVIARAAWGQIPTKGNVFFGYSHATGDVFTTNCSPSCPPGIGSILTPSANAGFNGWEASAEGKFLPLLGIVVDVGRYYGSHNFAFVCTVVGNPTCPTSPVKVDGALGTYLVGPRVSVPIKRFTPFAQVIFGAARETDSGGAHNASTSFATAIGGGLDYRLVHGLALRFQGDNLHTNLFSTSANHFRFSTGIDLRF
ncbi:MAG TPA: hypothetical protein VJO35_00085 [Terriglobales bacterium]|nr:hypothetical protein [Terriglobales bacterium]